MFPLRNLARKGLNLYQNSNNFFKGIIQHVKTILLLLGVLSRLKITSLDQQRKEAKQRYLEHLQAYVTLYLGRPMEKLSVSGRLRRQLVWELKIETCKNKLYGLTSLIWTAFKFNSMWPSEVIWCHRSISVFTWTLNETNPCGICVVHQYKQAC